jgi:sugar lactone lactonase YvrE
VSESISAEPVWTGDCELGEGSLWDEERSRLLWVDICRNRVCVFDPADGSNQVSDVGENVGTVVLTQSRKLLLALRSGFAWLDPATASVTKLSAPEGYRPDQERFNDGKCDPAGRFWAGTMVETGPPGSGALYCLDTDLTISKPLSGVTISNGLVWSRDRSTFYYVDTPTQHVRAYDFDAGSGRLSNERVAVAIPRDWGAPDGMAIDESDHLWIALFGGGKVVRADPASGRFDCEVAVPARNVTSCAFGGSDLDELYVTTARIGLDPEQRRAQPLAGSLFRAKLPYRGVPAARFGGVS